MYIVGELESHETLRKLINDIRIELKALEVKLKEKLRSKFVCVVFDGFHFSDIHSFLDFNIN